MSGTDRPWAWTRCGPAAIVLALAPTLSVAHADWLVVKTKKGQVKFKGRITHMDHQKVVIVFPSGEKKSYPRQRVLSYQAEVPERIEAADRLFKEGRFGDASAQYEGARQQDVLSWIWRRSLDRLMTCYQAVGDPVRAADTLLELLEELPPDVKQQGLVRLPLAWSVRTAGAAMQAKADAWLGRTGRNDLTTRAARLLAASVFISAGQPDRARDLLGPIASGETRMLADMARVQAWRLHLSRGALADRVRQWRDALPGLDDVAQAGAHYVLGQAYELLGDPDAAALCYMHVVVLHGQDVALASLACVRAAQVLQKRGRPRQAEALFREVLKRFGATPARAEAEKGLREIVSAGPPPAPSSSSSPKGAVH